MAKAAASGLYRNTFGYFFGGGSGEQDQDNSEEDMDKEERKTLLEKAKCTLQKAIDVLNREEEVNEKLARGKH